MYMMTNKKDGVLYVGVTSHLARRVYEHRNEMIDGFTKKYKCKSLVYYEPYEEMTQAIIREKQIKAKKRMKKIELIEQFNPSWGDLSNDICN